VEDPSTAGTPRIWREGRIGIEAAALLRSAVYRGADLDDAHGQPVLLIPGFLAGDDSLGTMTHWLRRTGHRTKCAGMRANVGCSERAMAVLEERVAEISDRYDRPVAIVGQSRGGLLARVLAVRHPERVSGIVTLGSPHTDCFAVHPLVRAQIAAVGLLGTLGVPGLFKATCQFGSCCRVFTRELASEFPEDVGFVSVYSKRDGVVRWQSCLDPAAEHVEVDASHCGMAVHDGTYAAVAAALAVFRAGEAEEAADGEPPAELPLAA
jgi:pimeloyl-ACP methyl ester carboxylesterase